MTKQRTFVPEDLYRLVLVSDPRISPDGSHVAFVRSHVEGEKKELRSHIWMAPITADADGAAGAPRPYTRGPKSDSQPRWSPDGRRLAFVRQTGEGPRAERQIWIIDRAGGEAYQLTAMRNGAGNPVWSPDGRYLAFVSAVDDEFAQAGNDAIDPAKPKTDADRKRDEQRMRDEAKLFTRFRYKFDHAGLLPPRRSHVWIVRVPDAPPAPAMAPVTDDEAAAQAEAAAAAEIAAAAETAPEEAAGAAAPTSLLPTPVQVTSGPYDHNLLDWSPDGRWIAVASSHEDERKMVVDIWLFPVPHADTNAAEPIKLTASDGVFGDARFSPDGRHIAVVGHHREFGSATLSRLWLFPAPDEAGEKTCLTADWDRSLGGTVNSDVRPGMAGAGLTWAPDGSAIYFVADDRGATQLYRVDLERTEDGRIVPAAKDSGPTQPTLVIEGKREIYGFSLSKDGNKAALAIADPHNPGDIYCVDLDSKHETRLTYANDGLLRHVKQPDIVEVEFTSHDGLPIHGWIMKPVDFEEGNKYPAVLNIHGGPHTCWGYSFSLEMQLMAAMGYAVIYVNPRGSTSYGQQFVYGCVGDYGGADYKDLMAAVDYAVSLGFIDEERLAVTGGSYGGFMTNWIVTQTNRFKAAITHRSISNWVSFWGVSDIGPTFLLNEFGHDSLWNGFDDMWERSPLKHVQNVETPILICHSENDLRCPMEQAEQLYLALKWLGKPAELLRHPRSNHDLTRTGPPTLRVDRFRHIARFLNEHVPAGAN